MDNARTIQEELSHEQHTELNSMNRKADKVVYLFGLGYNKREIAEDQSTTLGSVSSMISRSKSGPSNSHTRNFDRPVSQGFESKTNTQPVIEEDVELKSELLGEMIFPETIRYTSGSAFDRLWSEDGGIYSGTINIVTGESGVGKSTVLIHYVSNIQEEALYLCSEMTRMDLQFYMKKVPIIKNLRTVVLTDYIQNGGLKVILEKAFLEDDAPIVILDSFQDTVEKLKDIYGWPVKHAENFLINLMVKSAEDKGKCVVAIQHMTKGGQYVGRSYLKHATTSMLEVKFDDNGGRYVMFSKNRRNGGMVYKPMAFTLEDGEILFDESTFNARITAEADSRTEADRKEETKAKFDELFKTQIITMNEDEVENE